ncbi:putative disease resistance protein At1g50180 [Primulina eburnea]|uniref:putative disease resistance protein At1g50180 n=1 Tax=Primulina eburnea TaxID=1245227 RepID=UPI003C6C2D3B
MKLLMEKLLRFPLPLIHGFPLKLISFATLYFFTNKRPPKIRLKIADIAVHFLLSNLRRLIIHHARLILGAKNQAEMLENDIRLFKAFLKDSAKKRLRNDAAEEFVRGIRVVVSEGEYVIGAFENLAGERRGRDFWKKLGFGGMIKLVGITKEVRSVRIKVERICSAIRRIDFGVVQVRDLPEETKTKVVREENVDVKEIEVVSVICMQRVGKIFRNLKIAHEFPVHNYRLFISQGIWSDQEYLAQKQCARRQKGESVIVLHQDMSALIAWDEVLLVSCLKSKRATNNKMVITTRHGKKSRKFLLGNACLIVMDDECYGETWNQLKVSLLDINNGGQITSGMKNVVVHYSCCYPREMEFQTRIRVVTGQWLHEKLFARLTYRVTEK